MMETHQKWNRLFAGGGVCNRCRLFFLKTEKTTGENTGTETREAGQFTIVNNFLSFCFLHFIRFFSDFPTVFFLQFSLRLFGNVEGQLMWRVTAFQMMGFFQHCPTHHPGHKQRPLMNVPFENHAGFWISLRPATWVEGLRSPSFLTKTTGPFQKMQMRGGRGLHWGPLD